MRYVSTRGAAPALDFEGVTLAGMAADGGLYVPEQWPHFSAADIAALAPLSYPERATRILRPLVGDCIPEDDLAALVADAYAGFDHPDIVPLVDLGDNEWLMELHHGPTLAFKDLALQVLGRLFDYFLGRRGERLTIVGATSGDTGSAAIEACKNRPCLDIFMLHPRGRVTDIQRKQMTTCAADNVHNIAIEGTFDDCQALVKALFADPDWPQAIKLAAVNSINWARIAAQIVYYFHAAAVLGPGHLSFAVPTGNFGDVYAGYGARRMGLDIGQLIVATNVNDILDRALTTGRYETGAVEATMSPSMDIQISSNFERLLYDLFDHDGAAIAALMDEFGRRGRLRIPDQKLAAAKRLFASHRVDEAATARAIAEHTARHGEPVDPHTAVGLVAGRARRADPGAPLVFLATAHAAKFPDAVGRSGGGTPAIPERLAGILEREERFEVLPDDIGALKSYIRQRAVT